MAHERGFTIVEIVVTVFVLSVFVGVFTQAYIFMSSQALAQARRSAAVTVANANLAKYRSTSNFGAFNCRVHTSPERAYTLLSDGSSNKEPVPAGNYGRFSQRVAVYSPGSCERGTQRIVESRVIYGHPGDVRTITQVAQYVY